MISCSGITGLCRRLEHLVFVYSVYEFVKDAFRAERDMLAGLLTSIKERLVKFYDFTLEGISSPILTEDIPLGFVNDVPRLKQTTQVFLL
jgi:hypothetical protein